MVLTSISVARGFSCYVVDDHSQGGWRVVSESSSNEIPLAGMLYDKLDAESIPRVCLVFSILTLKVKRVLL